MEKTYIIVCCFCDETETKTRVKVKPSLREVLAMLYFSEEQGKPSCTCIQVLIDQWPEFNDALGLEAKFVEPEGVLVQIFNLNPKSVPNTFKTVSKFFLVPFPQFWRIRDEELALQKT